MRIRSVCPEAAAAAASTSTGKQKIIMARLLPGRCPLAHKKGSWGELRDESFVACVKVFLFRSSISDRGGCILLVLCVMCAACMLKEGPMVPGGGGSLSIDYVLHRRSGPNKPERGRGKERGEGENLVHRNSVLRA